jgi:coenzyme F420 hydrogenase subunit beta
MADPTLSDIVDNGLCTGCGACAAVIDSAGVQMRLDGSGYLRPEASTPLDAQARKRLDEVCAGRTIEHGPTEGDYHPLWGPLLTVSTGYAQDLEVRYKGSSGGVISALGIALIEADEVDFVLHTAADPADPIGNLTRASTTRDDILAAAGSRYGPSSPLADIEYHLRAGKRFAFVGKPCDVAALRRMAKLDPRIDRQIPYMLAFFCAGVPSRVGTIEVLRELGVDLENVSSFQYRGDGWPGLAKARRHDGSEASMDYNSSWGTILNRHLQFRCKICPDGTGEFADIACADAWYGKDGYPDFAERDGRSLIVARTERGNRLLGMARRANHIVTDELPVDEIEKMQPYQANRKRNALSRATALWTARRTGPRFRRLSLIRLAASNMSLDQLRNAIGTFRRARGAKLV